VKVGINSTFSSVDEVLVYLGLIQWAFEMKWTGELEEMKNEQRTQNQLYMQN